jgi:hypothetical protein
MEKTLNSVQKEVAQEAIQTKHGLIEMYQAGFLDGYKFHAKSHATDKGIWGKIAKDSKRYFEKRFFKKINKRLNYKTGRWKAKK